MKKMIFIMLIVFVSLISFPVSAGTKTMLVIDGSVKNADIRIFKGTAYVPLRLVSETLGASVNFNKKQNKISISSKNISSTKNNTWNVNGVIFSDLQIDFFKEYYIDDDGYRRYWFGTIKAYNSNTFTTKDKSFQIVFYDKNKKFLGAASVNTYSLDSKSQRVFIIDTLSSNIYGYHYVEINPW